jgi:hypothetical protein
MGTRTALLTAALALACATPPAATDLPIDDDTGGISGAARGGAGGRPRADGGNSGTSTGGTPAAGGTSAAGGTGGEPAPTIDAAGEDARSDAAPDPDAAPPTEGPTTRVTTVAQLQAAINAAKPGETIVLANGSYASAAPITIAAVGTAAARITITAETVGGVTITGSAGFKLDSPAAFVTLRGFTLRHTGALVIAVGTAHCEITRNLFELTGPSGDYLWVQGLDHEISYNRFQNKAYAGAMVQVDASGRSHAGTLRPYFHHNHWLKHSFAGANGGECLATWGGFTRVEQNLFQECNGDPEIITVKASDGLYRGNTFRTSTRGQLSLRYSNRVVIDGNFLIGLKGGLRAYGADQTITNNYFEGNGGTAIMVSNGAADGTYIQINRMLIAHNTLVDDAITGRAGDLPPIGVTIANNIIVKTSGTFVTEQPGWQGTKYEGNILWGAAAPGAIPTSGYRVVDPKLTMDAGGRYHVGAGSPAIDSGVGSHGVTEDIDGQPRTGVADVGADEASTAPVTRKPLAPGDVGPDAP